MRQLSLKERQHLSVFAEKASDASTLRAYAYADLSGQLPEVAMCCLAIEVHELHPDLRSPVENLRELSVPTCAAESASLFADAQKDWADYLQLRRNGALPPVELVPPRRAVCGRCLWIRGALEGELAGRRAARVAGFTDELFPSPKAEVSVQYLERKRIERAVMEAHGVQKFDSLVAIANWYRRWYLEAPGDAADTDVELVRALFEFVSDGDDGGRRLVRRLMWRMDE